jgi:hypothetical protein
MLSHKGELKFQQNADGLKVAMPSEKSGSTIWAIKITGLIID